MPTYVKKPVQVEAFEWKGDIDDDTPAWFLRAVIDGHVRHEATRKATSRRTNWRIFTLEGEMAISDGDFIIQGVKSEIYPCKPDIFNETYERPEVKARASEHTQFPNVYVGDVIKSFIDGSPVQSVDAVSNIEWTQQQKGSEQ